MRMASTTATSKPSKLIFAPGEAPSDAHQSNAQQAAQFNVGTLTRKDLDSDPFAQFHQWFSDPALKGKVPETVTLSTAELPSGRVSARMVYLKELDDRGFVIYSNWGTSRKAHDITTNPHAALTFWWKPLERQVRIEGKVERLTNSESQIYFNTRARGSRIGAWASQQSSILPPTSSSSSSLSSSSSITKTKDSEKEEDEKDDGRNLLNQQVTDIESRFKDVDEIPVPDFWGGLRVIPDMIEFWQGRDSRLHDRFVYNKKKQETSDSDGHGDGDRNGDGKEKGEWKIERLSP